MASRFQSRLVGTIILVSLGVIFLPDLLDGKKAHYQDDITPIPIRPESQVDVSSVIIPEPVVDQTELPDAPVVAVIEDNLELPSTDVVNTEIIKTTSKNDYQEAAWIIQLMALKNADNANRLVEDLKNRGYTASSKKENGFTRILIGPNVSKEKLEKQLVELKKITGAEGQLIKFKPLNP